MAKHRGHNRRVEKGHRIEAATEFREAVAYMHGVADAVSSGVAPEVGDESESRARARSPSHRPTVPFGEEAPTVADTPAARRRTVPYASAAHAELADHDLLLGDDPLERQSGIRLRCAPLRQEWYDLADASGDQPRK